MSAVKNLRAMFEQKGETSPPDRGRSPGIPPSIGSESPRPLSKVRTNFIAIEKDGRIGLQREPSQDSILSSTRKVSGDTDVSAFAPAPANQETSNSTTDNMIRFPQKPRQGIVRYPQNQPATRARSPVSPLMDTNGAPSASSNTSQVEESYPPTESSRNSKSVERDSTPTETFATSVYSDMGSTSTNTTAANGKGKEKAVETAHSKTSTSSLVKSVPKSLNVPSANRATAKPAKLPTVSKAPKGPAEASAPRLAAKTPERGNRQPEKPETPAMANSSKPLKSSSVKRPPPLQPSSSPGFVKPKPKSPTRPVKLPPGLTSHTAASGSKLGNPRQSASRGATLSAGDQVGRSPSRTSVSTAETTTRTAETKTIKRQSSSIGRPRPSLGPPPKQAARDHPPTKKEREVDENFLARMTRPTQASASKTQEKVATTPPRKHMATTTATAAKKPVAKATTANTARRIVRKAAVDRPSSPSSQAESQTTTAVPMAAAAPAQPLAVSQTTIITPLVVVAGAVTISAENQDGEYDSGVRSFTDSILGEESGDEGIARQAENVDDAEDDKVSDTSLQPAAIDDVEAQSADKFAEDADSLAAQSVDKSAEDADSTAVELHSEPISTQPVMVESEDSSDEYVDEDDVAETRSEPKGIYSSEKETEMPVS